MYRDTLPRYSRQVPNFSLGKIHRNEARQKKPRKGLDIKPSRSPHRAAEIEGTYISVRLRRRHEGIGITLQGTRVAIEFGANLFPGNTIVGVDPWVATAGFSLCIDLTSGCFMANESLAACLRVLRVLRVLRDFALVIFPMFQSRRHRSMSFFSDHNNGDVVTTETDILWYNTWGLSLAIAENVSSTVRSWSLAAPHQRQGQRGKKKTAAESQSRYVRR